MKITEYPKTSSVGSEYAFITDDGNGTKQINASDLAFALLESYPMAHRSIVRGKNLGNVVTQEQLNAIRNGTFEGLWLGDYWTIQEHNWRIVDFNYWYNCGTINASKVNHLVIMPDDSLYTAKIFQNNVTGVNGNMGDGYKESYVRSIGLNQAKDLITSIFGSNNIYTHKEFLVVTVDESTGTPTSGSWPDCTVELPSEIMIYGSNIFSTAGYANSTSGALQVSEKKQLALFAQCPEYINVASATEDSYWLRDSVSSTEYARVYSLGAASYYSRIAEGGIRPVFAIH